MKISLTKINLGLGNNPKSDWILVLVLGTIVGVTTTYGAVTLFLSIRGGADTVSNNPGSVSTSTAIKPADIAKYSDTLIKRDADFETIKKTPYAKTFDPSK